MRPGGWMVSERASARIWIEISTLNSEIKAIVTGSQTVMRSGRKLARTQRIAGRSITMYDM